MDKKVYGKENALLGKLRSNFLGTEFIICDKGEKKKSGGGVAERTELGAIIYEANFLGSKGPRQMTVISPPWKSAGEWTSTPGKESSIVKAYRENSSDELFILTNKAPKWNSQVRAYVLDFNNRVTMPSVKNFQLINQLDPNNVILQFGRVGKEAFSLDFRFPLSPLQAFAIALSSCDYKLVCE